jgi:hypothetical protein
MKAVAGVFKSRKDAERAVSELRSLGIAEDKITLLTPEATEKELEKVPVTNAEESGIGTALGAMVGGAVGVAGGFELTTAIVAALIPGIGPLVAIGALGAAVLGTIGAVSGGTIAGKLDSNLSQGMPEDELFIYEDALRQKRTVVIAMTEPSVEQAARGAFERTGAESVDRARESWWLGARDVEKEHYTAGGGNFEKEEPDYRAGFEAAQFGWTRGKSYGDSREKLLQIYPGKADSPAFKHGFERGQKYREARATVTEAAVSKAAANADAQKRSAGL